MDDGWVGMQGIPSNNDFAHMPWFHFDSRKAAEADIGVTKRLADFILKHADEDSSIYHKAEGLKDRYRQCGKVLLHGYPDYDPIALNIKAFDPATYPAWLPLPVYFVASPESSFYPDCKRTVDMNLDAEAPVTVSFGRYLLERVQNHQSVKEYIALENLKETVGRGAGIQGRNGCKTETYDIL